MLALAVGLALAWAGEASAADLFMRGNWAAMASDRPAERVGDSLTVLIDQTSLASNTAQSTSSKATNVRGEVATSKPYSGFASLGLNGAYSGNGQAGRADKVLAQISVVVDGVLANGDLHVSGEQALNINGEHIKIRLRGRLRRMDISSNNTILSTRLADASIDYDGSGIVSRGAKPGIVTRVFSFLGAL